MDNTINSIHQSETTMWSSHIRETETQTQNKKADGNQEETAYDAVSSQGDTLSISDEGRNANSETSDQTATLSRTDADGTVLQKANTGYSTETDSSDSTINLSGYTETELKQMY